MPYKATIELEMRKFYNTLSEKDKVEIYGSSKSGSYLIMDPKIKMIIK